MIKKRALNPQRVRRIKGGFSFIPHRFVTNGYLGSLSGHELLLYLFLVTVSDRSGLSFYSENSAREIYKCRMIAQTYTSAVHQEIWNIVITMCILLNLY